MKPLTVIAAMAFGVGLTAALLFLPTASSEATQVQETERSEPARSSHSAMSIATFAGGCFWCVEAAFEKVPGVSEVISGYSGGTEVSPTYREVASGNTGHTEAVQVHYDENIISYEGLLQTLWRTANPTDINGQYVDRGQQYRPEIFYHNEMQRQAAILSKQNLNDSNRYENPVLIKVTAATAFYPAEDYHQDYYKKNPVRYKFYTRNSGRYQFIDSVWSEGRYIDYSLYRPQKTMSSTPTKESTSMNRTKTMNNSVKGFDANSFVKPSDEQLKTMLSKIEYNVTQKDGTERAFSSELHDEKRVGLYVDIVSGEPLFSSSDKYDSGTGWPSFSQTISDGVVVEKTDRSLFGVRTEIRSSFADSHLGHVFNDGPAPTGNRYCMNAAAMRFIPLEQMAELGYDEYIARVSGP